jgi:glycosyltransferase involved in cell wall biosynthesis
MSPRLGVLAYWPIQYHSPLYQRLAERGNVELDVFYLSDKGARSAIDPEFGVPVAWDIDLLSGYKYDFMTTGEFTTTTSRKIRALMRWLPSHDAVVVNGYTSPWMLTAMAVCRSRGIPYLLRASSHPEGVSTGMRRYVRKAGTRAVIAAGGAGLCMGDLNEQFYRQNRARKIFFAPNSVDDQRFAAMPAISRSDLLKRWGLADDKPVIMYCGKLYPGKRPLDLCAAIKLLPNEVNTIFVGDGALAERVRASLDPRRGVVTGFINQAELPSYYHAADIIVLPSEIEMWGLVINEGMAAGALPVVSHRVGAASDLVQGVGHVYPCGDIASMGKALSRALEQVKDPATKGLVQQHVARYSLERTAAGFEEAALAVGRTHSNRATAS